MGKFAASTATLLAICLKPALAGAQDFCFGTVVGLSNQYNPATGSGFLALRAGPTASAVQIGELFNGNVVKVIGKRGSWFRIIDPAGATGWVSRTYVSQSCGL
jgi:SH3-like domain-containing protein